MPGRDRRGGLRPAHLCRVDAHADRDRHTLPATGRRHGRGAAGRGHRDVLPRVRRFRDGRGPTGSQGGSVVHRSHRDARHPRDRTGLGRRDEPGSSPGPRALARRPPELLAVLAGTADGGRDRRAPVRAVPRRALVLRHTFLHVPGIGAKKERDLWERGYTDWEAFVRGHPAGAWRDLILERLDLERAASDLPKREAWRLADELSARTLFLDIETTGLSVDADAITCVGVSDGSTVSAYVRGENLARFPEALHGVRLLVTYNGASFDLPVLARAFPRIDFARFHHVDLRFPLRRLGVPGGLEGLARTLGIDRPDELSVVDGLMAVRLWRAHRAGRDGALETLVRYCLEDVVNLRPLLAYAYNRLVAPLPIPVPRMEAAPRPHIPHRADAALVRELLWGATASG